MTFDDWFKQEFKSDPKECLWVKFDLGDLKAAFENGYNLCRDNWGGLDYSDPANDFTNGLKR
jgi:hypothetical protein